MEILPHGDGSISRTSDTGSTGRAAFVHSSVCPAIPLVSIPAPGHTLVRATDNRADGNSGECASHFQQHLKKYPPQVSSRKAAAGWACFIHNEVNIMLDKPEFDCTKLGEFYDCGCADDEETDGGEDKGAHAAASDDHGLSVEISREASVLLAPCFILAVADFDLLCRTTRG